MYQSVPTHSTIGSWAIMLAQTVESYGINSDLLFEQEGIEPEFLRQSHTRIVNEKMYNIWHQAKAITQDPYIALRFAKKIKPCALNALGLSLSVSQNTYDALNRFTRYSGYLNDVLDSYLSEEADTVKLTLNSKSSLLPEFTGLNIEAIYSAIFNLLSTASEGALNLKAVHFQHDFSNDSQPYQDFFQCPVYFSQKKNQMIFNKNGISDEYIFANSVLTSTLDDWIEKHSSSHHNELISTQVQNYILTHKSLDHVNQDKVAANLNLSPRMLQRKLKDEGISYTKLMDCCRKKMAFKFISDNKISLSELTLILGFTDQSNFSRAFKRWSGSTPLHYRNNKMQLISSAQQ